MRGTLLSLLLLASASPALAQTTPRPPVGPPVVTSPNGALVVTIGTEGQLTWSVTHRGRAVIQPSRIAMTLGDGRVLGEKPLLTTSFTRSIDTILKPVVRYRRAEIRDRFNEVVFAFAGNYALVVRAYDDGVAYRWKTTLPGEITVAGEDASLTFAGDHLVYFPEEESLLSHQERQYKQLKISEITAGRFSSLPAMAVLPGGVKVVHHRVRSLRLPGHGPHVRRGAEHPQGPVPGVPEEGGTEARPRRAGGRTRAFHREDPRHARVPLARARRRRARCRPARHRHRLSPRVRDDGEGHELDQAGQGGVGLVEQPEPLRRAVHVGREHRHLQALHRLRGGERPRVHHPRRGLVHARRPACRSRRAWTWRPSRRTRSRSTSG